MPEQRSTISQLTMNKTSSQETGNPFKSQATQWNKKHENCTKREGRTVLFCLHQSSHHPRRQNPPHPSALSPIWRPAKLGLWILLSLREKSRGSQYRPSSRNITVRRGLLCRQLKQRLSLKAPTASTITPDSCRFNQSSLPHPCHQVFVFALASQLISFQQLPPLLC